MRFDRLSLLIDPRARVTVRCDACGRRTTYSADEFRKRLPPGLDSFEDMRRGLRCELPDGCGRKAAVIVGWIDTWA